MFKEHAPASIYSYYTASRGAVVALALCLVAVSGSSPPWLAFAGVAACVPGIQPDYPGSRAWLVLAGQPPDPDADSVQAPDFDADASTLSSS